MSRLTTQLTVTVGGLRGPAGGVTTDLEALEQTVIENTELATDAAEQAALAAGSITGLIDVQRRWFGVAGRQIAQGNVSTNGVLLSGTMLDGVTYPASGGGGESGAAQAIVGVGDSLTQGTGGGGVNYLDVLASVLGIETVNLGIGGQTTRQVVGRMAAVAYGLTVDSSSLSGGAPNRLVAGANEITAISERQLQKGDVIAGTGITSGTFIVSGPSHGGPGVYQVWPSQNVASTANIRVMIPAGGYQYYTGSISGTTLTVTAVTGWAVVPTANYPSNNNQILATAADNVSRTVKGWLGSVRGTYTRIATGGPPSTLERVTFTPDAGQTLPAYLPPNTPFVPDYAYRDHPHVIWIGRNNDTDTQRIISDTDKAVKSLGHRNFVVMSVINGSAAAERKGGAKYDYYVGIEQEMADRWPLNYLPIRRLLIDKGLSAMGITPTAQDLTDIADDTVPASLRSDTVHLTGPGYTFVGQQVATFMTSRGMI